MKINLNLIVFFLNLIHSFKNFLFNINFIFTLSIIPKGKILAIVYIG
jgi:hypothetical protein